MSNEQKLREALQDITDDYAERFDLDDPSTNPGIKIVIQQARQALATTEPAVNQQLTTEPVVEREEFEKWANDNAIRTDLGAWEAWQARAAMAQVGDINAVESFTNDTKDAERYRWLRDIAPTLGNRAPHVTQYPGQSFDKITYLDATKVGLDAAIDAAMAKGVK